MEGYINIMKSEKEKMLSGEFYNAGNEELVKERGNLLFITGCGDNNFFGSIENNGLLNWIH